MAVIGGQQLVSERFDGKLFIAGPTPLDPGFAYWVSLPDTKLMAGNFRGTGRTDLMVVTANGLVYSETSNGDGTFRVFALGSRLPNFSAAATANGARIVVGDLLGTGRDSLLALGGVNRETVMAVGEVDGTFTERTVSLDPGFAYWVSLPDTKLVTGRFR